MRREPRPVVHPLAPVAVRARAPVVRRLPVAEGLVMAHWQLFDKPPRRMKQPRKDEIRWRAELAEAKAAYAEADRDELLARTNAALREANRRTAFLLAAVLVLIALGLVAGKAAGLLP